MVRWTRLHWTWEPERIHRQLWLQHCMQSYPCDISLFGTVSDLPETLDVYQCSYRGRRRNQLLEYPNNNNNIERFDVYQCSYCGPRRNQHLEYPNIKQQHSLHNIFEPTRNCTRSPWMYNVQFCSPSTGLGTETQTIDFIKKISWGCEDKTTDFNYSTTIWTFLKKKLFF